MRRCGTYLGGDLGQLRDWEGLVDINVSAIIVIPFKALFSSSISCYIGVWYALSGNAV